MDIEKEKSAFLGIYKYYPSAIKFTFDVENECFVLSKKNPLDHEVEVMSQMNQQWQAWFRRAKLEYEKLNGCVVVRMLCMRLLRLSWNSIWLRRRATSRLPSVMALDFASWSLPPSQAS